MFEPVLRSPEDIFAAVYDLAEEDFQIFQELGHPLDLLENDVVYRPESTGRNIYANVWDVLARGQGDCEDLSAWLLAYLWWFNIPAEPLLLKQTETLWHVLVVALLGGRWVALDPSKWKGMCYYASQQSCY